MSNQQLDLCVHYSIWQQQGWKRAFMKFGNTSEGRGIGKGGLGRDYCIREGGCWGIHGQSCLAPAHSTVRGEAKRSSSWGGPWLNVCLNPLMSFQSKPFARAYRISAWSHGRAQLPLGKADTTQWLSEAELNRPRSPHRAEEGCAEIRQTQYPFRQGGRGLRLARSKICLKYLQFLLYT